MRRFRDLGRELNWKTIIGETLIIIVGVALGIQVSNWNDERLERRDIQTLLQNFQPEIDRTLYAHRLTHDYYDTTDKFAGVALAGWQGNPVVSDKEFVIAAYQASQISGFAMNGESWSRIFGAEQVQRIDDPALRDALIRMLSMDWDNVSWTHLQTDYRQKVRRLIPPEIQDLIRAECGDQFRDEQRINELPKDCDVDISADDARRSATVLRSNPELAEDLNWHRAQVATYRINLDTLAEFLTKLNGAIESVSN